jgi:hypothetical protein
MRADAWTFAEVVEWKKASALPSIHQVKHLFSDQRNLVVGTWDYCSYIFPGSRGDEGGRGERETKENNELFWKRALTAPRLDFQKNRLFRDATLQAMRAIEP